MEDTYLSTHRGDIGRWAAELDAVPVREEDGYAIVDAGDVGLDQEKLHWDEFHGETEDAVVVRHEDDDGRATLSAADRYVLLDRLDLAPDERQVIEDALEAGETVTLSADEAALDVGNAAAASGTEAASEDVADRRSEPQERDTGKPVVAANGDEVGIVTAVGDGELFVDPHPGLTESALATLGWSGVDDEDVPVDDERIEYVTAGVVRLSDEAEREEFHASRTER